MKPGTMLLLAALGGGAWYLYSKKEEEADGDGVTPEGAMVDKGEYRQIDYEILENIRAGTYAAAVWIPYGTSPGDRTVLPGPFASKDAALAAVRAKVDEVLGPE